MTYSQRRLRLLRELDRRRKARDQQTPQPQPVPTDSKEPDDAA